MAEDWLKVRKDLLTHPKVVRISCAIRANKLQTIGALISVWSLFDSHSDDGRLDGYTPEVLDEITGQPGISGAMHAVGWLEFDPIDATGPDALALVIPRFETHMGKSAKRRALNTERMRNERLGLEKRAPDVRDLCAKEAHQKNTRNALEKRREEYSTPIPPEGDLLVGETASDLPFASPDFAQAWATWETSRREARKAIKPTARRLQLAKLRKMGEPRAIAALLHSAENGYQGIFEPKTLPTGPAWRNAPQQKEAPPSRRILNHPEPAWDWKKTIIALYGEGPIPDWSTLDQLTQEEILANEKGDIAQ